MKLLVRNLARTTTEKELTALFIQFGRVQSCDLVLDKTTGKSKGFAFVEMPKAGEAKVAIKKLNNRDVAGNRIRVKKAETQVVSKPEEKIEDKIEDQPKSKTESVWKIPK
ncbi:RNA-binding protein [hydrothermal vent metagenome]|uniref:RNA-binding protein n=1 Tax=hydrothermal vent metagenome TaxID=652676 RepID=A0A3B0VUF0_9ZZZZ